MITRRRFLTGTAAAAGGVSLLRGVIPVNAQTISPTATVPLAQPGRDYTPTIAPNNVSLPWKIVDGAKVYHLIAEEVNMSSLPVLRRSAGDLMAGSTVRQSKRLKEIESESTSPTSYRLRQVFIGTELFCQTEWMAWAA